MQCISYEKPIVACLVGNFPLYADRSFITMLTIAGHWPLFRTTPLQFTPLHYLCLRLILALSYLCLGLLIRVPAKTLYELSPPPHMHATCPSRFINLLLITYNIWGEPQILSIWIISPFTPNLLRQYVHHTTLFSFQPSSPINIRQGVVSHNKPKI